MAKKRRSWSDGGAARCGGGMAAGESSGSAAGAGAGAGAHGAPAARAPQGRSRSEKQISRGHRRVGGRGGGGNPSASSGGGAGAAASDAGCMGSSGDEDDDGRAATARRAAHDDARRRPRNVLSSQSVRDRGTYVDYAVWGDEHEHRRRRHSTGSRAGAGRRATRQLQALECTFTTFLRHERNVTGIA